MTIYSLTYVESSNTLPNVKLFSSADEARSRMKKLYAQKLRSAESSFQCEIRKNSAEIKEDDKTFKWKIDRVYVPICVDVAIEFHEGMVQSVYTNSALPVRVDVFDRDISVTSPEDDDELNEVENALYRIRNNPAWKKVW